MLLATVKQLNNQNKPVMKKQKETPSLNAMTTTPEAPATPPPAAEEKALSVEDLLKDWKDLQKLEKAKKEIETQIKVIQDRIQPAYKELGAMLGLTQEPTKPPRKPRAKAGKGGGGGGRGGAGGTQVETAKGVASKLGAEFTIDEFRSGLGNAGLKDANVNYLLQQLKKQKVIKSAGRGKFKKA